MKQRGKKKKELKEMRTTSKTSGTILKNRDITSPTKVHVVKTMVFPVVMYGCESWTEKKAEHQGLMLSSCGARENS